MTEQFILVGAIGFLCGMLFTLFVFLDPITRSKWRMTGELMELRRRIAQHEDPDKPTPQ